MYTLITLFVLTNILLRVEGVDVPKTVNIINYENVPASPDGEYKFSFLTDDLLKRKEIAKVKNAGTANEVLEVKGEYSYVYDGKNYKVYYIADENGYRVVKTSPFDEPPVHHFPAAALGSLVGGGLGK